MRRYLVHRLMAALFVLVGVSFVVFLALHLTLGDPAQILLGPMATPAELTAQRGQLGLDQPVLVQYGRWISRAAHGDLGRSIMLRRGDLYRQVQKLVVDDAPWIFVDNASQNAAKISGAP